MTIQPMEACFRQYLCVFHLIRMLGARRGGALVRNLLVQFSTLGSSKIEEAKTYFFYITTTQNDHPTYGKHVLGSIYVFLTLFGYWVRAGGGGGLPRDWCTASCAFFHPGSSKIEEAKTYCFDTVITQPWQTLNGVQKWAMGIGYIGWVMLLCARVRPFPGALFVGDWA